MQRRTSGVRVLVAVAAVSGLTIACSGPANPTGPAPLSGAATNSIAGGTTAGQPAAQPPDVGRPTPAELTSRGWTCFTPPPAPHRIVCSHPGQGFPVVATPPPDDRPPTFSFWVYEFGTFAGTELLIRTDLYRNQLCESTGKPYDFVAVIGYYECVHRTGR